MRDFVKWFVVSAIIGICTIGFNRLSVADFITTGVYDPAAQANAVDIEVGQNSVPLDNGTDNDFRSHMANAFAAGTGGVIDFDNESVSNVLSFNATFGTSQEKTLTITRLTVNSALNDRTMSTGVAANSSVPISGTNYLGFGSGDGSDFIFEFSEPLVELGFTVLSRDAARGIQLTINYTDNSTFEFTGVTIASSTTQNQDTFFNHIAPSGKSIKSITAINDNLIRIDDFGFVTVPEPSSILLLILGTSSCWMMGSRRRK